MTDTIRPDPSRRDPAGGVPGSPRDQSIRLAKETEVPPRRINVIVHGKRSITADTSLRLAKFFGTSDQFWLNLQARHDLEIERDRLAGTLGRIHLFETPAKSSEPTATKSRGKSRSTKSLTEAS